MFSADDFRMLLTSLGELRADTRGNREAMLQRTGDMERSINRRIDDLKESIRERIERGDEEIFHRFERQDEQIERLQQRAPAAGLLIPALKLLLSRHVLVLVPTFLLTLYGYFSPEQLKAVVMGLVGVRLP